MFPLLKRLRNGLVKVLEWILISTTGLLVVVVVWQVFTRFALSSPSSWTEEMSVFLLMWMSLLGASVAYAEKAHLGVDYFVQKMNPSSRRMTDLMVHILVAFFAGSCLVYGGWRLVSLTLKYGQKSAAMEVEMGYIYMALPVAGLFILLFACENIFECLAAAGKKEGDE